MSTPVQRQYWELKNQNPEAVLFFRLGDFYELFFEDAHVGAQVLGITLTARHKGTENQMPMAGFPHHAHKDYLEKLIDAGYKVAIAEQKEGPDGKISRFIARLVTPGTTLESGNLNADQAQYLLAIGYDPEKNWYGLAYADASTGEFKTAQFTSPERWWDELYKLDPKEILLSTPLFNDHNLTSRLPQALLTPRPLIKPADANKALTKHFPPNHLSVAGVAQLGEILTLAGMVFSYLQDTQRTDLSQLTKLTHYQPEQTMALDTQTFRHLEVFNSLTPGEHQATLWSVFKRPLSAPGGRTLRQWLLNPLLNRDQINQRLSAVEEISHNAALRNCLEKHLKALPDLERLLTRLCSGRGNARDLAHFRDAFAQFPALQLALSQAEAELLTAASPTLEPFTDLHKKLDEALAENPPLEITQGGMFKDGFNPKLDEYRSLTKDSTLWLEQYVEQCKQDSGITHLKVTYSKNFGFSLEVSNAQISKAPASWTRRQTLTNAERFTTPELSEYETRALAAESESYALEHQLFGELRDALLQYITPIQTAAQALAVVDALLALARTAQTNRWCQPVIREGHGVLNIKNGRHPVVEQLSTQAFVANSLSLNPDSRLHLISGPNMAGKSTFLRQNALIILLAQIGSFVPAKSAELSIYDRIFTRVGASDNLAAGQSTFFVEMAETARILHAATQRSFVVLDEIGRGTSTFDGLSLAWAITECLHNDLKANTLFATHYHELIDLAEDLPHAANFHVSVTQNEHGIVFLRHIKAGGIADSFGIEVAKLAGIPGPVVHNAQAVLQRLESESLLSGKPNLFSTAPMPERANQRSNYENPRPDGLELKNTKPSAVEQKLSEINPDDLSPKEALEQLYELKKLDERKD